MAVLVNDREIAYPLALFNLFKGASVRCETSPPHCLAHIGHNQVSQVSRRRSCMSLSDKGIHSVDPTRQDYLTCRPNTMNWVKVLPLVLISRALALHSNDRVASDGSFNDPAIDHVRLSATGQLRCRGMQRRWTDGCWFEMSRVFGVTKACGYPASLECAAVSIRGAK